MGPWFKESCWVTTRSFATCPYRLNTELMWHMSQNWRGQSMYRSKNKNDKKKQTNWQKRNSASPLARRNGRARAGWSTQVLSHKEAVRGTISPTPQPHKHSCHLLVDLHLARHPLRVNEISEHRGNDRGRDISPSPPLDRSWLVWALHKGRQPGMFPPLIAASMQGDHDQEVEMSPSRPVRMRRPRERQSAPLS